MLKVGQLSFLTDPEKKKQFGNPRLLIDRVEKMKEKKLDSSIYTTMSNVTKIDLLDSEQNENKEEIDEILGSKYVISSHNKVLHYWDTILSILIAYSCVSLAYYCSFDHMAYGNQYWFDLFQEFFFQTDLILNFFTEYIDRDTSYSVKDLNKIAKNYVTGFFFWDLIACLPIVYIVQWTTDKNTAQDFLYFKLVRFVRLPKFMTLFSENHFDALIEKAFIVGEELGVRESSREQKVKIRFILRYIYNILTLIFVAITLTYILACLWHYFVRDEMGLNNDWNNFRGTFGLNAMNDFQKLVLSAYFVLTTQTTVGYGEITPVSNFEQALGIILMILGIGFFSYVIGNFNNVLTNYDNKMGIVNKKSELQDWINSLAKFNNMQVPKHLRDKIDKHFNFFWENDRLCGLNPEDEYLQNMPNQLRMQLVNYLFEDVFKMFRSFFHKSQFVRQANGSLPSESEEFYYEVVFMLLPIKIEAGTVILKKDDMAKNIYLVFDGEIIIEMDTNQAESEVKNESKKGMFKKVNNKEDSKKIAFVYKKSSYFGEYSIFSQNPEGYIYTAKTDLCVYELSAYKFINLINKYPDIKKVMRKEAFEKKEQLHKRFKIKYRDEYFPGENFKDKDVKEKVDKAWTELKAVSPNQTEQEKQKKYDIIINQRKSEINEQRFSRKKIEYYDAKIRNTLNHVNTLDNEFKQNFSNLFTDIELISEKMAGVKNSLVKNNQAQV